MLNHILTIDSVLEEKNNSFDNFFETIKKNIRVKKDGEKDVTYTSDKEGYKIMFDEDGNPVETKMETDEKIKRKKGAVNSALKQKKTKKVVMTHMKQMREADDDEDPDAEEETDDEFDTGEDDEEDAPKSETIYNDLEAAIDDLDAFKLKNASRMYEQMLKQLIDDASIKLLNFVYETIPPSRRKTVSADIFVKQVEDQVKEKKK